MNSFGRTPWKAIWVKQITLYIFIIIFHALIFRTCFCKSPSRDFIPYNKQMTSWTEIDRNLQNEVRLIRLTGFSFSSNNFHPSSGLWSVLVKPINKFLCIFHWRIIQSNVQWLSQIHKVRGFFILHSHYIFRYGAWSWGLPLYVTVHAIKSIICLIKYVDKTPIIK